MTLQISKFQCGDQLAISKIIYDVRAKWQYTAREKNQEESVITRYELADDKGKATVLEERGTYFALLRAFPPAATPEVSGSTVTVMGSKYSLAGMQKLSYVADAGQTPSRISEQKELLSVRFVGPHDQLLREIDQATKSQQFYAMKTVRADDMISPQELAAILEAQKKAQQQAQREQEDDDDEPSGSWLSRIGKWLLLAFIVGAVLSLCSSDDSDDESRSSARGVSGGFHGK